MKKQILFAALCLVAGFAFASCGDDEAKDGCDPLAPDCNGGEACEIMADGSYHCVAPLLLRGQVVDFSDDSPVADARIQAVDANGSVLGATAISDSQGFYALQVPSMRNEEGQPVDAGFSLRAAAEDYDPFPSGVRVSLPIDPTSAQDSDSEAWVIEGPLTLIKLLPLPASAAQYGRISGEILGEATQSVLLVAESANDMALGFSDADGHYVIFNLPPGEYSIQAYAAGAQFLPEVVNLAAGEHAEHVDIQASNSPLATVRGNVQIVNAPGGSLTSVVLAVESTFVENAARGQVPPGLRIGDVSGDFVIENVPDGRYVVLAAFENDDLVRDPDQTIGGTRIVHIEVPDADQGTDISLPEGFKVTEALAVIGPGADGLEEISSLTPTLSWADDSSESGYELAVFDAFGEEIWRTQLGPVSGQPSVDVPYGGPALEAGMVYQFRAWSQREKNGVITAISATEDLKGVFTLSSQSQR